MRIIDYSRHTVRSVHRLKTPFYDLVGPGQLLSDDFRLYAGKYGAGCGGQRIIYIKSTGVRISYGVLRV